MNRIKRFQRPLYKNSVRITFRNDSCRTILRVISRHVSGNRSFYLTRYRFLEWLENRTTQYLEMDGSHLLRASEYDGIVSLHFYWMCEGYGGQITGYAQNAEIPLERLRELMHDANGGAFFTHLQKYAGRVRSDFSGADQTLRFVCADKLKRRALSKALRSRIGCRFGEVINAYNDFSDSFYLIHASSGGRKYNGGLVLHHCEKDDRPYFSYSFHT